MTGQHATHWLQLKTLLRDVHPAVWRRVRLVDSLSIADLHHVIQALMGWEDDHLHRFRIQGQDYGIPYIGGPIFAEDAASVCLARFAFRPSERFLYEYHFTAGWQIEVRVERATSAAPCASQRIPICVRAAGPALRTIVVGRRLMRSGVAMCWAGRWRTTWTLWSPFCSVLPTAMTRCSMIPQSILTSSAPCLA